jgi:hypothetical protein
MSLSPQHGHSTVAWKSTVLAVLIVIPRACSFCYLPILPSIPDQAVSRCPARAGLSPARPTAGPLAARGPRRLLPISRQPASPALHLVLSPALPPACSAVHARDGVSMLT